MAFPSKWHNHDCAGDQIKKLSWQFPQVLHGKKEGQLMMLCLSVTSFNHKTFSGSLFSTLTFTRPAGRSQQPSGHRAQGLGVQALVDRRGKGEGRGTDLPTEQGWHNTRDRGQQYQHVLSALGQLVTSSLGAQHQCHLDPDRSTSSHHMHTKTHISWGPCQKVSEAPKRKRIFHCTVPWQSSGRPAPPN